MFGGAGRDRTDDLKLAKLALSQLSYGPDRRPGTQPSAKAMVGPVRFELTTPRLSSVCSNQLSYEPQFGFVHSRKGCGDGERSLMQSAERADREGSLRRHP